MLAGQYDFSIEQGTSFRLALVYKDNNNDPINITGWCARLTWKTSSNIVQTFSTDNIDYSLYKFEIDGVNGKLTLLLPASLTNEFTFTNAKYEIELQSYDDFYTDGGKYTVRILEGTITISKRKSKTDTALECA